MKHKVLLVLKALSNTNNYNPEMFYHPHKFKNTFANIHVRLELNEAGMFCFGYKFANN